MTSLSVQKDFLVHVYDSRGNPLAAWPDVSDPPTYTWPLNAGPGAVQMKLARTFGNADEPNEPGNSNNSLRLGNQARIYVIDRDASQTLVYNASSLEEYEFDLAGEVTAVTLFSLQSLMQDAYFAGPVTLTMDPTAMMQWFITNGYLPGVTWDAANPLVGQTYSQTFMNMNMGQAMETVRSLAGGTWFWRLNRDNSLTFSHWDLTAAPTHKLTIGRHVAQNVVIRKSRVGRKQQVYVYGAPGISNVATAPDYNPLAPRTMTIANPRITDFNTAGRIASAYLEFYNRDFYETEFDVIDNNASVHGEGYDIESILPGQTIQLFNPANVFSFPKWGAFVWGTDSWGGNYYQQTQQTFVIAEVDYAFTTAHVKLQQKPLSTPNELMRLQDSLLLTQSAA